jgi:2-polyprenyl-3-methyl-5-hydroxy-6-metoxy-1,4-benzoquinol methylase
MYNELIKKGSDEHKYTNKNYFHRLFLTRFLDAAFSEINKLSPKTILDFGCGEGFFLKAMKDRGLSEIEILGVDIRKESIERAKKLVPEGDFRQLELFQIYPDNIRFDLVMAIEVLEHLYEPDTYLKRFVSLSRKNVLITVPFEPWFRMMNLFRGRDILRLGNHPEHINHWSTTRFQKFLEPYVKIENLYVRFPWIVCVGKIH